MKKVKATLFLFIITISLAAQDCINVDYKLRGYFYAGTSNPDPYALGGHARSGNVPKKITQEIYNLNSSETFKIVVVEDSTALFRKKFAGMKVYVVNMTNKNIRVPAQDGRIYLKRQVYYKGEWQDVEYLPNSWCGNSLHNVYIDPNEYWEFTAPCLEGQIVAKFRFELRTHEYHIYSNQFYGSFNESQLEYEQGHKPNNLMDPYNN